MTRDLVRAVDGLTEAEWHTLGRVLWPERVAFNALVEKAGARAVARLLAYPGLGTAEGIR